MAKNKYIAIGVIVGVFILFALIQVFKSASYDILQVNNPFEIVIDKNVVAGKKAPMESFADAKKAA